MAVIAFLVPLSWGGSHCDLLYSLFGPGIGDTEEEASTAQGEVLFPPWGLRATLFPVFRVSSG